MSSFLLRCVTKNMGGGGSKCGALRNANEKIENALINIVSPKTSGAIGALVFPSA